MAQISMRVDDAVKKRAAQACEALGLSMTTAINLFLVKLGNEKRIPFDVAVNQSYNPDDLKTLGSSVRQMENK